ncbi:MAG: hypothetical protein QM754_17770 [Tepidisphaeraceae bacterium]
MKGPEVHRWLKRRFIPLIAEHGFEAVKPFRPVPLRRQEPRGVITLGYSIGKSGNRPPVGNAIRLEGNARGQSKHLGDFWGHLSENLLPPSLLAKLRAIGRESIETVLAAKAETEWQEIELHAARPLLINELDRTSSSQTYTPPFQYHDADDLEKWCRVIRPHIHECIEALQNRLLQSDA